MRTLVVTLFLAGCAPALFQWEPAGTLPAPSAKRYGEAPAVVLSREQRWTLTGTYTTVYRRIERVAVLSEAGYKHGRVEVPVRNGKLIAFNARTVAPDGQVFPVAPDDLHEMKSVTDAERDSIEIKRLRFQFPHVTVGSVLEYFYEIELPFLLQFNTEALSDDIPLQKTRVELLFVDGVSYGFQIYNSSAAPKRDTSDGYTRISIEAKDLPAIPHDGPPWQISEPWWAYRVKSFYHPRWGPHSILSDWPSTLTFVAKQLYDDKHFEGATLTPDVASCARDTRCIVDHAIAWLRDATELSAFVNAGTSLRPLRAVLAARRANNFEKALLLVRALRQFSVDANLVLVGRNRGLSMDPKFPLPDRFDHLVVQVPSLSLFIDPSCDACAPGELPSWSAGRKAMVLRSERKAISDEPQVSSELVDLPRAPPDLHQSTFDAKLSADGVLTGAWSIGGKGEIAVLVELGQRRDSQKLSELIEGELRKIVSGMRIDETPTVACNHRAMTCEAKTRLTLPGYAAVDGDRLHLPLTILTNWQDRKKGFIPADVDNIRTITVSLPDGWTPESLPQASSLQSPPASVAFEAKLDGQRLTLKLTVLARQGLWKGRDAENLKAVGKRIDEIRSGVIVLKRR
jgi:hypothetical protein